MAVIGQQAKTENETQQAQQAQQQTSHAPAIKITELFQKCSSQGGWAGESQDYLNAIRKKIEDPSMTVQAKMQYLNDDAVAFSDEQSSVVLVRENDVVNLQSLITDSKFYAAKEAFYHTISGKKLVNVVSCNKYMFGRASQMASYISQTLMGQSDEQIKNLNIDLFGDRYIIKIDTEMSNVRQFMENHSPNPVVCGNFGFIASIVDKGDHRQGYQQSTTMFATTGYVEFVRSDTRGVFIPLVHITDIVSPLGSTKIMAIALPLIAEIFITRGLWRHPFTAVSKDGGINIGNLIVDATNQKPYEVKTELDYRKMFREYIAQPLLCIDVRAGHTYLPGLETITRQSDHELLAQDIYRFLNIQPTSTPIIGQNMFKEIVGVFETSKTVKYANLMDTRDVTYLFAVSKLKWSPKLDYLLARNDNEPIRRFELIREIVGEVTPTHSSITVMLRGDFINTIASVVASKITNFDIPTPTDVSSIDMSDFIAKAYQPGMTSFGQTGPSALGTGYIRW